MFLPVFIRSRRWRLEESEFENIETIYAIAMLVKGLRLFHFLALRKTICASTPVM